MLATLQMNSSDKSLRFQPQLPGSYRTVAVVHPAEIGWTHNGARTPSSGLEHTTVGRRHLARTNGERQAGSTWEPARRPRFTVITDLPCSVSITPSSLTTTSARFSVVPRRSLYLHPSHHGIWFYRVSYAPYRFLSSWNRTPRLVPSIPTTAAGVRRARDRRLNGLRLGFST